LTKWAVAQLGNDLLPVCFHLVDIHPFSNSLKLLLHVIKERLVLKSPFVEFLLHAYLSDRFVGAVVKLSDLDVCHLLKLGTPDHFNYFCNFDLAF
jgi:hypothetical protein